MTDLGPAPFKVTSLFRIFQHEDSQNSRSVCRRSLFWISLDLATDPPALSIGFRAGESIPNVTESSDVVLLSRLFHALLGRSRVFVVATSGSAREPLTSDAFFLSLSVSPCLSRGGTEDAGARCDTSRHGSGGANTTMTRAHSPRVRQPTGCTCGVCERPSLRLARSSSRTRATDVELQLRPLATTTVANVVRWCWIGQQWEIRA